MKLSTLRLFTALLAYVSLASQSFALSGSPSAAPISFRENKGQVSDQDYHPRPDILFSGNVGSLAFHLKSNGISYQLSRVDEWAKKEDLWGRKDREQTVPSRYTIYRVDISWLDASPSPHIERGAALKGYENYYLASCPQGALYVKSYSDLTYKNLYPGIDLKWYEKNGALEYDYYIAAGADYKKIRLQYQGAEKIYVDHDGTLVVKTPLGTIKEQKPLAMQNNRVLDAKWVVRNNTVSFEVKQVNPALPLVIDPVVRLWATYYGGTGMDDAYYTYATSSGEVFLSGSTESTANIATSGAQQATYGGGIGNAAGDGYIVKFDASGNRLWATYYGGSGTDYACESIADANGNVYLTGGTASGNAGVIATPGTHQNTLTVSTVNSRDAFLVKFNASGVRQWGTYYGGEQVDYANGISLDNSGNIFITGGTTSTTGIATTGAHQPTIGVGQDCFLAKFSSTGALVWGTYYGYNGTDVASDCVTSSGGDTYMCGATSSSAGISTAGGHQPVYAGGPTIAGDAFIVKFDASGVRQWGTYYGASVSEVANHLTLDETNNALYCVGFTSSNSGSGNAIATPGSHQSVHGGVYDAFLVKFDLAGVRDWGTFYGGLGSDYGASASIDPTGHIYISGDASTSLGTAIATACAYQPSYGGGNSDGFLAKFASNGKRIWGTYYGGPYIEQCYCSFPDGLGNVYLSGLCLGNSGTVIATPGGFQPASGGGRDAFLVKFDGCAVGTAVNLTPTADLLVCSGKSATLSATCGNWFNSASSNSVLATGPTFTTGILTSDTTFYVEDFVCGFITGTRTAVSVTLVPTPTLMVANSHPTPCVGESIVLTVSGAITYSWINTAATTTTVQLQLDNPASTTYTVDGYGANGCKATATIEVAPVICDGLAESGITVTGVAVYPNPSSGSFTIRSAKALTLRLTDELGQTIRTIALTPSNGYAVSIDRLANGVYFLAGEKDSGHFNRKIVVMR